MKALQWFDFLIFAEFFIDMVKKVGLLDKKWDKISAKH